MKRRFYCHVDMITLLVLLGKKPCARVNISYSKRKFKFGNPETVLSTCPGFSAAVAVTRANGGYLGTTTKLSFGDDF